MVQALISSEASRFCNLPAAFNSFTAMVAISINVCGLFRFSSSRVVLYASYALWIGAVYVPSSKEIPVSSVMNVVWRQ